MCSTRARNDVPGTCQRSVAASACRSSGPTPCRHYFRYGATRGGRLRVSHQDIADLTGLSKSAVQSAIRLV
jgi:hypothetical protein